MGDDAISLRTFKCNDVASWRSPGRQTPIARFWRPFVSLACGGRGRTCSCLSELHETRHHVWVLGIGIGSRSPGCSGPKGVLAGTRSDSRRLIERSGFGVRCLRQRSSSPSSSGLHQGTSALGFCQSTSGLDVVSPHCIREPTDRDRPAGRRLNDTPFCGTRYGRTRSARSCGSVRRYRWSAGSWFWCASDRCPRPRDRARTHAAPDCHSTRCRGRSIPVAA